MQFLLILLIIVLSNTSFAQEANEIPHLEKRGTATQLIVDGKPFLMIAGELGNSSASDMKYMEWIWPKLKTIGLNTLLAPVYWELVEPEEKKYDFTLVDSLINEARKCNLRLVFLWFGSWKNSMSCYTPSWVKMNYRRFPRSVDKEGRGMEMLSAFSIVNRDADARAFAEIMRHVREVDSKKHTVIMVQVENEIGMIPCARDFNGEANKEFSKSVPDSLINYLKKNKKNLAPEFYQMWEKTGFRTKGTWEEVFGKGLSTDEIFMAWHYAKYVNTIAERGKVIYPLPTYVNAALIRPGYEPGKYPSAGPLPHIIDIWRAGAPSIDFLSPDIYFSNFSEWCKKYDRLGNPLFIPEVGLDANTPANALYSFGEHSAMGFSPFSIEFLNDPENAKLIKVYDLLHQLTPIILESQKRGLIRGVLLDGENQTTSIEMGDFKLNVAHDYTFKWAKRGEGSWPRVGGMIISIASDEFYIAGSGIIVTFEPIAKVDSVAGIVRIDEGKFVDGRWIPGRRLNGDQSHQGRHLRIPNDDVGIQRVKLYRYN